MKLTGTLISLLGASCLVAFASAAPAAARTKPCCYASGEYFNSTPSTCQRYGGRVVEQDYCQGNYQGNYGNYQGDYGNDYRYGNDYGPSRRNGVSFSFVLGNVAFGYSDGYYDRNRRWHGWRNNTERNWYQRNHRDSYHHMRRDHDRDHNRRDWRNGRRHDWRNN
jgi:hypothetical protein